MSLTIGSLFSGVGGLELGLERALGARVLFQVEIDARCRMVLAKHWPEAQRFDDVRAVGAGNLPRVDLLCGGFPCQDLSTANHRGVGLAGAKSGLWTEYQRVVKEIAPEVVVVENVAFAWREWVPVVRRDLWDLGYASVPVQLSSVDVGAPHDRQRIFVIAHADRKSQSTLAQHAEMALVRAVARVRREDWGKPSSGALGVADGVPDRMDRLKEAGNAVVPQVAEAIGYVVREVLQNKPA